MGHSRLFNQTDMKSLIILASVALASAQVKRYDGYKVLRTPHLTKTNANLLQNLQIEIQDLDFWRDPRVGQSADISVSPQSLPMLEEFLNSHGIQFSVMIEDLEKLHQQNRNRAIPSSGYDWKDYHSHADINNFIDDLAASNAGWVSTQSIGKTYEDRDMRVIKIEKAGPGAPIAWIEAGIHAREWIASATATFIINELVNNYEANKDIVDNLNIHILPMTNPDGYEYSRNSDRYWRKNRSPQGGCKGSILTVIGLTTGVKLVYRTTLALIFSAEILLSLKLRARTSRTTSKGSTPPPCWATPSTATPNCGSGHTDMPITHTP